MHESFTAKYALVLGIFAFFLGDSFKFLTSASCC